MLVVAYDGTAFSGYARQPDRDTIEKALRDVLSPLPGFRRLAVAGRTDRGVSAAGQVVSFRTDSPIDLTEVQLKVDRIRPGVLQCLQAIEAPYGFHAQFWATERRYLYFLPESYLPFTQHLDHCLRSVLGRRCFRAFGRNLPLPTKNTVRHLRDAGCRVAHLDGQVVIAAHFAADGFLRAMVRTLLAAALYQAQRGQEDLRDWAERPAFYPRVLPLAPEPLMFWRAIYPIYSKSRSGPAGPQ